MKKLLFAIFAHPDDESFGPSGTILTESLAGTEVHLISLTAGEAGTNPDNVPDLKAVRLAEWHAAGALMGAHDMHYLGYSDSKLNNSDMLRASQQIIDLVTSIAAQSNTNQVIEFVTSDLNGITGHIDHIVAARAACLAFYRLRESGLNMSQIRLTCIPADYLPTHNTDWLYMEPGRPESEIDQIVDAREHNQTIISIMKSHHSQRGDCEAHLKNRGESIGLNYFRIMK